MNESVYNTLTEQEKALLADLYETPSFSAMKKALANYQLEKAQWVLANAPNHEYTLQNRGAVEGANFIIGLLRHANQVKNKKESSR